MENENKFEKIVDVKPDQHEIAGVAERKAFEERIWNALRQCYDPEIPVNLVDLGLIYEVKVENESGDKVNVYIKMTLTAPGCSMGPMIAADVRKRVQQLPDVGNVMVDVVFDPIWNPGMMSEAARLMLNMS